MTSSVARPSSGVMRQSTGMVPPLARGSKPTRSYRSPSGPKSSGRISGGRSRRISAPGAPGPPKLTTSEPMRRAGSDAGSPAHGHRDPGAVRLGVDERHVERAALGAEAAGLPGDRALGRAGRGGERQHEREQERDGERRRRGPETGAVGHGFGHLRSPFAAGRGHPLRKRYGRSSRRNAATAAAARRSRYATAQTVSAAPPSCAPPKGPSCTTTSVSPVVSAVIDERALW